jgi:hypothetical protein
MTYALRKGKYKKLRLDGLAIMGIINVIWFFKSTLLPDQRRYHPWTTLG